MTKDDFMDVMNGIDGELVEDAFDASDTRTVRTAYGLPSAMKYFICGAACAAAIFMTAVIVQHFNGVLPQPNTEISSGNGGAASPGNTSVAIGISWATKAGYIESLEYGEPVIGGNAILSRASLDGIEVRLVARNITKLPGEAYSANGFDYADYYGASEIVMYARDGENLRVVGDYVTPHTEDSTQFISSRCLFEDSTRIYKAEEDGREYYVVMQYADYDKESGALLARFYNIDTIGLAEKRWGGQNNIETSEMKYYDVKGTRRIGVWGGGYQASKSFAYKGGAVFADPEYGYEITIKNSISNAKVIYPEDLPAGYEALDVYNITGWNPDKLEYDPDPEIGKTVIVDTDTAGGMTASLIMQNVIKRPGESNYLYSNEYERDMWVAEEIYLYLTDNEGNKALIPVIGPMTTSQSKLLPSKCLFDGCMRIFKTDRDGEEHYIVMQCVEYNEDKDMPVAIFADGDIGHYTEKSPKDENGVYKCGKMSVFNVIGAGTDWNTKCFVSKGFEYKGGTTFREPEYGYEITFDPTKLKGEAERFIITGFDPEELNYTEPEVGGSAVLSEASLDGIDVSLFAYNISHLPEEDIDGSSHTDLCDGSLCADRILLYLKDDEGRRVLSTQINAWCTENHHRIPAECLFDGSTRIYKVEQDGKPYYLLMQFAEYDKDSDALIATFYVLDMELYSESSQTNENGIPNGGLWIFEVRDPENKRVGNWAQAYQASKDFAYKGGTTFVDPEYGYEITFDMERGNANVVYINQ